MKRAGISASLRLKPSPQALDFAKLPDSKAEVAPKRLEESCPGFWGRFQSKAGALRGANLIRDSAMIRSRATP